jgi:hypothetical protein
MGIFSRLLEGDEESLSTKKIKEFSGVPIARNNFSKLCIEYSELAGFRYMNFQLFSPMDINTFKGCRIGFKNGENEIMVDSDTTEIVTFFSDELNHGFTEFDVEIENEIFEMIKKSEIDAISIYFKKQTQELKITNLEYLKKAMEL